MRFMNKPISSGEAAIGERVGLTAEGQYYGGKLGYLLGVYNGGEEKTTNRAGLAYGARLESAPLGPLAKLAAKDLRVHLGAGFVLDQGPSVTTTALSGDLTVQGPGGWGLFVEYLMDTRAPLAEPILPASLPGTVERNVLIVGERLRMARPARGGGPLGTVRQQQSAHRSRRPKRDHRGRQPVL